MSKLQATKDLVTMASMIAVPVVVAFMGYRIEGLIAQQQVGKDYVLIALDIIESTEEDDVLRGWAVDVLEANSPVPFSDNMRESLVKGDIEKGIFDAYRFRVVPTGSLPPGSLAPGALPGTAGEARSVEASIREALRQVEEASQ